jgi:hypothetical protein
MKCSNLLFFLKGHNFKENIYYEHINLRSYGKQQNDITEFELEIQLVLSLETPYLCFFSRISIYANSQLNSKYFGMSLG